ncbi:MAG: M48 family metalloprotease [Chitinophagales bacterium]
MANIFKIKLLIILVCLTGLLAAQTVPVYNFTPLQSAGAIPADFTRTPSQTYFLEDYTKDVEDYAEAIGKRNFFSSSVMFMDKVLHSGYVIFGDSVTNYLNQVKDEILKHNPDLKGNIRIYTLLSNDVNAFAADNGVILVTTGLLAKIQNEAQLAFVLCHEFSHYYSQHALEKVEEQIFYRTYSSDHIHLTETQRAIAQFKYSKEQEYAADDQGLQFFKNTNYDDAAIDGLYDILLYSYLPYQEISFPKTYFNDSLYHIPETNFRDSIKAIKADDENDPTSSHPDVTSRRARILSKLTENDTIVKSLFIHDENTFRRIQQMCRYEGCILFLQNADYPDALYQAFLLESEHGTNTYLNTIKAKSLYGMSMYKNRNESPESIEPYSKVQGESQQIYYLFSKMKTKDFNVLALKFSWDALQQDTNNVELKKICNHLAFELQNTNATAAADFFSAQKSVRKKTINTEEGPESFEIGNGQESIMKKLPAASTNAAKADYWRYAFFNVQDQNIFADLFDAPLMVDTNFSYNTGKKGVRLRNLGLNNIVLLDPLHSYTNNKSYLHYDLYEMDQTKADYRSEIKEHAEDNAITVMDLSYYDLDSTEVDKFNKLTVINQWLDEKLIHLDMSVPLISSSAEEVAAISANYGISNIMRIGMYSTVTENEKVGTKILMGIVFIPYLPFAIADVATPLHDSYYYAFTGDMKTDNVFFMQEMAGDFAPDGRKINSEFSKLMNATAAPVNK